MSGPLAVMDVGASNIRLALSQGGRLSTPRRSLSPAKLGPEAVVAHLVAQLQALPSPPGQLGVAIFGLVQGGRVTALNTHNAPGWDQFPLQAELETRLGYPVSVMNDALAATLGERERGAGRGSRSFLYLTVSTGIGAGLALGEPPVLYGAELGYTVWQNQWVEHLSSGTALARLAAPYGYPDARALCDAADASDSQAAHLLIRGLEPLSEKLLDLCVSLNVQQVALGGSVGRRFATLNALQALCARTAHALKPRLLHARLGDEAGLIGLLCALEEAEFTLSGRD